MQQMSSLETVQSFVQKLNRHDVDELYDAISADHVFVDSLGFRVSGREKMRSVWVEAFKMMPNYRINPQEIMVHGDTVAVFGTVSGQFAVGQVTLKDENWEVPGAWKGRVRNGLIEEWHLYSDNEPIRRVMRLLGIKGTTSP